MRLRVPHSSAALRSRHVLAVVTVAGISSCASTASAPRLPSSAWADARPIPASARREYDDEPSYFAKRGFFVGGMGVATTLSDRDFDGQSGLVEPNSGAMLVLPELDPATGWGATIGYRSKRISVQYTYTESKHDDDFLGTSLEDDLQTYSLDFKHYWNVEGSLQPYLLLGITVPRVTVKDGANLGGNVGDAKFQGLGGNLGGGATLYITPHLALFGEAFYRWADFDRASALGVHADIQGHLDASGIGVRGGLTYTF